MFHGSLTHLLQIYFTWLSQTNSSIGNNHDDHVFLLAGSCLFNCLLPDITSAATLTISQNRFKTYRFSQSFPS